MSGNEPVYAIHERLFREGALRSAANFAQPQNARPNDAAYPARQNAELFPPRRARVGRGLDWPLRFAQLPSTRALLADCGRNHRDR